MHGNLLYERCCMGSLNVRLDDELERQLAREAEREERTRSELAREAIEAFLAQRQRQRFLDEIARAARERGASEAVAAAEESLAAENEALALAEKGVAQPRPRYRARRGKR
jgi:hypothetical protein